MGGGLEGRGALGRRVGVGGWLRGKIQKHTCLLVCLLMKHIHKILSKAPYIQQVVPTDLTDILWLYILFFKDVFRDLSAGDTLQQPTWLIVLCYPSVLPNLGNGSPACCIHMIDYNDNNAFQLMMS